MTHDVIVCMCVCVCLTSQGYSLRVGARGLRRCAVHILEEEVGDAAGYAAPAIRHLRKHNRSYTRDSTGALAQWLRWWGLCDRSELRSPAVAENIGLLLIVHGSGSENEKLYSIFIYLL